jgi:hypothetical protein
MRAKEPAVYKLPITEWPESDRPREKLMQSGPLKLTETELLAILLRSGSGGNSAIDVAVNITKEWRFECSGTDDYLDILNLKSKGRAHQSRDDPGMQLAGDCRLSA